MVSVVMIQSAYEWFSNSISSQQQSMLLWQNHKVEGKKMAKDEMGDLQKIIN